MEEAGLELEIFFYKESKYFFSSGEWGGGLYKESNFFSGKGVGGRTRESDFLQRIQI